MDNIIVGICVLLFFNIPVGFVFRKAWFRFIDAFIPIKNIIVYSKIVNYKHKLFVVLTVVLLFLTLIWLMFSDAIVFWLIWLLSAFARIGLLGSAFGSVMYMLEGIVSYLWEEWLLFAIISGLVLLILFPCLIAFYCKLHYKFALKFWLNRWVALLYIFFHPIIIWVLAFWKWEYQESAVKNNHNKKFWEPIIWALNNVNVVSDFGNNQWHNILLNDVENHNELNFQEKKNNRFFIIAMIIIFVVCPLISFIKYQKSGEEHVQTIIQRNEESIKVVKNLKSWASGCSNYSRWSTKLGLEFYNYYSKESYEITWTLIKRETDWTCFEAYNFKYIDKIKWKKTYVSDYSIVDYWWDKEILFRCVEHNWEVVLLESEWNKLNSKDWCGKLYMKMYDFYKYWLDEYDICMPINEN